LSLGFPESEKKRLLHCVVVGGGPTGVEFSGELSDFIMRDVRERYARMSRTTSRSPSLRYVSALCTK
jgi:NADH dehydrogenase FAD-containing subunit